VSSSRETALFREPGFRERGHTLKRQSGVSALAATSFEKGIVLRRELDTPYGYA
jgi:hypothetical protein